MQPRFLFALLPSLAVLLLPTASRADSAWCATGKPESVLACLSAAYQARDIEAYARLMAPDFKFQFISNKTGQPGDGWDRANDLTAAKHLFTANEVASIRHEITASNPPVQTGPDTWEISGIFFHMTVTKVKSTGAPLEVNSEAQVLKIRAVATPEPHFEIYEWVDQTE